MAEDNKTRVAAVADKLEKKRDSYDVDSPVESRRLASAFVAEIAPVDDGEKGSQRIEVVKDDGQHIIVTIGGKSVKLGREGVFEAQRVFSQLAAGF